MLFRGENEKEEVCKACNASRWIVVGNKDTSDGIPEQLMHKVPAKVIRYFPLKPRLQRNDLHPVLTNDGKAYEIRAAIFDMMNKEKETFCAVLENDKMPYGSASNIRRSRPEASITEGYLTEECIIFCSRFLNNDGAGKIGKYSAKSEIYPQNVEYPIGLRRNKDGKSITLKDSQWMECHRYVLFNCANKEVESLHEMEDDSFHVRIYHKDQFQNNSYVGGDLAIFKYVERDGGLTRETDVCDHSPTPTVTKKKQADVRNSPRKSARLNNPQDVNTGQEVHDATTKIASVKRKLDLKNTQNEDEKMGENEIEDLPPPAPLIEYEKARAINIMKNNMRLKQLSFPKLVEGVRTEMKGKGTMAAHVAMRKRQEKQNTKKTVEIGSGIANKRVDANDAFPELGEESEQDVPENLKTTLLNYVKQRYIFPDELEAWVLKSNNADWKGYKSHTKTKHFTAYDTDEERLENRPTEIPLEEFKLLLQYWGYQEIQVKDSDAAVFVKTRKRKAGRKYKTDGRVTNFIIEKIENVLGSDISGPTDGVNELLLDVKGHGPSWLVGRSIEPVKGELQLALRKLGEANPILNINMAGLCATISSDHDDGTPVTMVTPITGGGST
ncbi:hypothetical protein AgCh_004186 [Apium graveolens]